ncbi:hypothetical protein pben1_p59 [Paracoccus phage vB_PbeS_Pben1]|uniref:Uncharacterized protein n=2 Tax=Paracoccus TaxID=265 RepID=A0AAE6NRP3_PARPN|nr:MULTISPECIES: hypothetical protein [Paracoccus]AZV00216.1 hypothetical protein pben1_p59 [Paracoccus phage vB_PbeS_Pben1]QFG35331.1 hypothetical protein ESD82_03835 [Paracoccus pantotrophus]REF72325.1 hypothetical protein BDD41_0794 [Paracoccus versutus]RKS44471.1 hypothetical protein BDE18_3319 [Paracoccus pantotrophus]WGR55694.1 hypothetical protein E3U25_06870 [Paracoccus versutus]
MDTPPEPGLLQQALFYAAMVGAWITGEAGRAALAGAAGGLVRWWMTVGKCRLRDGAVMAAAGSLMSLYFSPVMLALLERWIGEIRGDAAGAAGFASGLAGMSLAKLVLGVIEAHARKLGGRPDA